MECEPSPYLTFVMMLIGWGPAVGSGLWVREWMMMAPDAKSPATRGALAWWLAVITFAVVFWLVIVIFIPLFHQLKCAF